MPEPGTPPDTLTAAVDDLPPTQYLIMEVLAARHRTGEHTWTFPTRLRPHLRHLATAGLIDWKAGTVHGTALAWLTDTGRSQALGADYTPPADRAPVRVVVVVNHRKNVVHGVTCDDQEAQKWVRQLCLEHPGAAPVATMTVGLVQPPARG